MRCKRCQNRSLSPADIVLDDVHLVLQGRDVGGHSVMNESQGGRGEEGVQFLGLQSSATAPSRACRILPSLMHYHAGAARSSSRMRHGDASCVVPGGRLRLVVLLAACDSDQHKTSHAKSADSPRAPIGLSANSCAGGEVGLSALSNRFAR